MLKRTIVGSLVLSLGLSSLAVAQAGAAVKGELIATLEGLGGAEMLAVSKDGAFTVVAGSTTVTLVDIADDGLSVRGTYELEDTFLPENSTAAEFTGVAISPDGTFALVAVKDDDKANLDTFDEVPGKVLALSLP
ncbi:MAG: hypothetical protein Q6K55_04305, partial [Thermostichus sp. DG02_3_bins_51]